MSQGSKLLRVKFLPCGRCPHAFSDEAAREAHLEKAHGNADLLQELGYLSELGCEVPLESLVKK